LEVFQEIRNSGQLIVDATCTPADIRYPNDISILNEARMNTERFIDYLYENFPNQFQSKPRDYRKVAHKDFIAYTKRRKPRSNVRRKALRKQLNYLRRDISHIDEVLFKIEYVDFLAFPGMPKFTKRHQVVKNVYSQQHFMHRNKVRSVPDRIVSISQPYIRPIVRGKAGKSVEFGAKISLSLSDGFSFVDRLSWDSFNESKDLIPQIEKYKERYGYYPLSVHADKIYQTRENRNYCKERNIRMTGKPLGRPAKKTEENKQKLEEEKKQRYQDDIDRIAIEGRFGVGKRRYGLGLIKSKLKETSETDINVSILVLNLEKICSEEISRIKGKYKIRRKKAA
jgi:IS5 family transposase